jgi:peptidyl-prolyl cis-trans isomerase A (cyclophilin A)
MARTGQPNSATAQFFINVANNDSLNHPNPDGHGYAVFGKVIDGMKTVDAIRAVRTASVGMFQNVPVEPVVIESVTLVKPKP